MSELVRPIALDRIGAGGFETAIEATPDEFAPVAARLKIPAVTLLHCRFRLRRSEDSVIEAEGDLAADVVQTCVVSLDDFPQRVTESFSIRFVPAGSETEDEDPESPDQIPYEGSALDLGEAAVEQLALALDPYPRKPGAEPPEAEVDGVPHPFAALAALRREQ